MRKQAAHATPSQAGALPLRHFRWRRQIISNTTSKGKTSEAVILAALVRLGKRVLVPWGEERYDLALDDRGKLVRIQCKTANIRDGCVCFKTSITDARHPLGDGGYAGQIDAFAVYCPQIERVYLVPIETVQTTIGAGDERADVARAMGSRLRACPDST